MLAGLPPLGWRKILGDVFIALLFELEHLETFSKKITIFFSGGHCSAGRPPSSRTAENFRVRFYCITFRILQNGNKQSFIRDRSLDWYK